MRIGDAVKRAAGDGMPAMAVTDLGTCSGWSSSIPGRAARGSSRLRGGCGIANPESADDAHRLLLLARNNAGYKQLCELLSKLIWLKAGVTGLKSIATGLARLAATG